MAWSRFLLACFCLMSVPTFAFAQQVVDLDAEPRCPDCHASVGLKVTLPFVDVGISPDYDASVAGQRDHAWAVGSKTFPGNIVHFAPNRDPRVLGRAGSGPGEFQGLITLRRSPLGVIAYDTGNRRFTPVREDGTLGEPVRVEWAVRAWRVTGQSEVLLVGAHSHEGKLYALLKLNLESGERTYGRPLPNGALMDPVYGLPLVGLDGKGHATVAYRFGGVIYTIRLSDLETVWEGKLQLDGLPDTPRIAAAGRTRPNLQVWGIVYEETGDLWILVLGPDEEWSPGARAEGRSLHRVFDTHFYVLDGDTRELKARRCVDFLVMPGEQDFVTTYLDDIDAIGVFELWLDQR